MGAPDEREQTVLGRIRLLLTGVGWDHTELARRSKLDRTLVSKYVKGETSPGLTNLALIADAFEVTTDFLLGRNSAGERPFGEVIRKETLAVYLLRNEVSTDDAWLLHKLSDEEFAPSSVHIWATTHKMIKRAFEIEQQYRRNGSVVPFKQ